MEDSVLSDEQLHKLVRSSSVALPLLPDPMEGLAFAMRRPKEEVCSHFIRLQREGILLGIWGEPNPELRGSQFRFSTGEPEVAEQNRWFGQTETGTIQAVHDVAEGGSLVRAFFKCGLPLSEKPALEQSHDRSFAVGDPGETFVLTKEQGEICRWLMAPRQLDLSGDIWSQIGSRGGLSGKATNSLCKQLVAGRRLRRLAFRYDLERLGYSGCALVGWAFEDESELANAARALASIAGTGDVALTNPSSEFPANLIALFLSREKGGGATAAGRIAEQWNRPLAFLREIRLH